MHLSQPAQMDRQGDPPRVVQGVGAADHLIAKRGVDQAEFGGEGVRRRHLPADPHPGLELIGPGVVGPRDAGAALQRAPAGDDRGADAPGLCAGLRLQVESEPRRPQGTRALDGQAPARPASLGCEGKQPADDGLKSPGGRRRGRLGGG